MGQEAREFMLHLISERIKLFGDSDTSPSIHYFRLLALHALIEEEDDLSLDQEILVDMVLFARNGGYK